MSLLEQLERRLSRGIEAQRRLKFEQDTLIPAIRLARHGTTAESVIRATLAARGIRLPEAKT